MEASDGGISISQSYLSHLVQYPYSEPCAQSHHRISTGTEGHFRRLPSAKWRPTELKPKQCCKAAESINDKTVLQVRYIRKGGKRLSKSYYLI